MRIQAWATWCAIGVMVGLSGCSTQMVQHSSNETDETEELLFGSSKVAKSDSNKTKVVQQQAGQHRPAGNPPRPGQPLLPRQQQAGGMPALSQQELLLIAERIFRNESGGNPDNLVHWNDGENFASMGVGHFTWYPAGRRAQFGNTFPELVDYLQANGISVPAWVQQARYQGAPWRSKAELMHAKRSGQVQDLQNLLNQTRLLQAAYIVERARRAMPKLVEAAPAQARAHIAQNLNAVANTPGGWYVLVDYINFKGEGLNTTGGYRGQNWGLLQVLEEMQPSSPGAQSLNAFADAAMRVLERRVRNSPPARNEARWLAGWSNRINTYRQPYI